MSAQTPCITGSNQECNPSPTDKLPNLAALRQDSCCFAIGSENKTKLQGGRVEVMVKNRIQWPHELVLT